MTKKFCINRSFWNSTAINRKIGAMLTRRILVDYFREMLLTYSTFASNQDTKIRQCDLHGDLDTTIKLSTITYNAKLLLDAL